MENLMTSISFWGFAAILATTLRITWEFFRIESKKEAARVASTFSQLFQSLFQANSKLVVVTTVCGLILLLLHISGLSTVFSLSFTSLLVGAFTLAISTFIHQIVYTRSDEKSPLHSVLTGLRPFFGEKATFTLGTLLLSAVGILFLFSYYSTWLTWNTYLVLNLLAAYLLGGCLITLLIPGNTQIANEYVKNEAADLISTERLDILTGVVLATALLGTTFTNLDTFNYQFAGLGAVILPIVLALVGSFVSNSSVHLMNKFWPEKPYFLFIEKTVITGVLILSSYYCITTLLPETWVTEGKEFSRIQIFYVAQAGLLTGLITSKIIYTYEAMEKGFIKYLSNKAFTISILDRALHTLFRVVYGIVPLLLLIGVILFAHESVGLYGVCITIVAMLSNFRTELSTEIAELQKLINGKIVEIVK